MKEDKKYYTPSIDEFYIGFGYERIHELKHYNDTWKSVEVTHKDNTFMRFVDDLQDNRLRVKYLDKEDIESLGWTFEKQHPGLEDISFSIDQVIDTCNMEPEISSSYLDYDPESKYLRISWIGDGDTTRFSGTIKNKSELKKLMKQLGIDEQ